VCIFLGVPYNCVFTAKLQPCNDLTAFVDNIQLLIFGVEWFELYSGAFWAKNAQNASNMLLAHRRKCPPVAFCYAEPSSRRAYLWQSFRTLPKVSNQAFWAKIDKSRNCLSRLVGSGNAQNADPRTQF
jgi:hypothetical protein